jgi:nicotinate-nucleotide adenylyltransferase
LTRLGLLGGTFDPPHYGHLLAAQEAGWRLGLAQVLFLPARQNPLKRGEPISSAADRCEMVRLAIGDNQLFALSDLEFQRPAPSYTVDLLRSLHASSRATELFFLAGGDILPELYRWYAPLEILALARLVIVTRPGTPPPDLTLLDAQLPGASSRIDLLNVPGMDISSTDLRQRVKSGQPITYLTPPSVERFIAERGLYR